MSKLREIVYSEPFGGILLFSFALAAIILVNSPWHNLYNSLLKTSLSIQFGKMVLAKPLLLWVNDGLMSIFFLFVGLEIKREILKGTLKDPKQFILPAACALGGFVVPALIYFFINHSDRVAAYGWAIPAATDIAFSLGILSLLGDRIPPAVKIFLTALAIIDDIAAIIVIAVYYTSSLSYLAIAFALPAIAILYLLNRAKVASLLPYLVAGSVLWLSVLNSGIHATLSGIILAMAIPMEAGQGSSKYSPLVTLENALLPWVTFAVLPMFAFANSGFSFAGLSVSDLLKPIPLGIMLGLFLGKQFGIFGTCFLLVKSRLAKLPESVTWRHMYGVSVLCGVGFTMSLFIGTLAYRDLPKEYTTLVRLGVLMGSSLSGLLGYAALRCGSERAWPL